MGRLMYDTEEDDFVGALDVKRGMDMAVRRERRRRLVKAVWKARQIEAKLDEAKRTLAMLSAMRDSMAESDTVLIGKN